MLAQALTYDSFVSLKPTFLIANNIVKAIRACDVNGYTLI